MYQEEKDREHGFWGLNALAIMIIIILIILIIQAYQRIQERNTCENKITIVDIY